MFLIPRGWMYGKWIVVVIGVVSHSAQWPHEELQHPPGALLDMGKHVGSLGFNIWKNMQTHVKYSECMTLTAFTCRSIIV